MSSPFPRKAYGYVRVSTDEQAEHGTSLRVQRAKIRAYAKLHDLRLVKIFADEGVSGRNLERDGLKELLKTVSGEDDETVIVYRLNRLSRHTRHLLKLIEEAFVEGNTHLVSVNERIDTTTPTGRFFLIIMAGLAQMERELIGDRTRQTLRYKKARGERLGATPFGYDTVNGELVEDKREMKVVRLILKLRKQGWTYTAIGEKLTEDGVKTKRGGKWHPSTVRYIVKNDRYRPGPKASGKAQE